MRCHGHLPVLYDKHLPAAICTVPLPIRADEHQKKQQLGTEAAVGHLHHLGLGCCLPQCLQLGKLQATFICIIISAARQRHNVSNLQLQIANFGAPAEQ